MRYHNSILQSNGGYSSIPSDDLPSDLPTDTQHHRRVMNSPGPLKSLGNPSKICYNHPKITQKNGVCNGMDNGMTIDMVMKEKTYSTKEASDYLGIADSTVRKWCLILEEHGYTFRRNEFQKREFTEHDVIALKKFKDLTKDGAMSLEDAAIAVVTNYNRVPNNAMTTAVTKKDDRYDERYLELERKVDELSEMMSRQLQFNEALLRKLDEQQKLFEERMELSDHRLLESVRMMNAQKELASAQEKPQETKKGFWQRLFGK